MTTQDTERVVPTFEVYIDGNRLAVEAVADIYNVMVLLCVDEISMCTLSLNAGDPKTGGIKWVDSDLFNEGNEITVKAGSHSPLVELFVGEIVSLEPEYNENRPVVLQVRAYDRLYRLSHGQKVRSFMDMSDSDIVSQISSDWQLSAVADSTSVTHPYVLQNNQTDMAFILERARRLGFEVMVKGSDLHFRTPQEDSDEVTELTFGGNLLSFFPRMSFVTHTKTVHVKGWDEDSQSVLDGQSGEGDEISLMDGKTTAASTVGNVIGDVATTRVTEVPESAEEADALAKGEVMWRAAHYLTGEGTCIGDPVIQAGTVVRLSELGKRFSGLYYVTSATHNIAPSHGYTTSFTVRRTAQ